MGFFTASWVVNHASHGNGEMAFQCLLNSFQRFATHTPKLHTTLHLYYMCVSTSHLALLKANQHTMHLCLRGYRCHSSLECISSTSCEDRLLHLMLSGLVEACLLHLRGSAKSSCPHCMVFTTSCKDRTSWYSGVASAMS